MKKVGLILIVSLLAVVPALGAVYNVNLGAVNNSGFSGSASTITGSFGGVTPHTHVEVNAMMNQMPSAGNVYEAWLVDNKNNVKQSLGVFDGRVLNADFTAASFSANNPWNSIAVSLEPANSMSSMPTNIVAMGSLPGSSVSAANFATAAVLPPDEPLQRQLAMQRFGLTSDQYTALRMEGLGIRDINVAANISKQCNQSPMQAADTYMRNGADLNAVAAACGISVASLLTPFPTTVAVVPVPAVPGTVGAATPMPSVTPFTFYRTYPNGAPVLTRDQWLNYHRRGYSWVDVAIAANIASMTGDNIDDLLRAVRIQGMTWSQIALDRGLNYKMVTDVSAWPWERTGRAYVGSEERSLERQGATPGEVGAGTMTPGTSGTMTTPPSTSTPGY